jgi:hypothetical protein
MRSERAVTLTVGAGGDNLDMTSAAAPVFIDVAAAAARPTQDAIAGWAADQRVFVSSVMGGMTAQRRAAVAGIKQVGAEPVCFEGFGGRDDDAELAYLSEVASSTVYVGILGRTYGRLQRSRLSPTHEEYREAERRGLRIRAYVRGDGDLQGDQVSFLEEIRQFHVTGSYAIPEDLTHLVADGLRWIAAEDLSPWCKVGDAIFRARSIDDDGTRVTVRAAIHDPGVLAALESLRGGPWASIGDVRVTTTAGRSHPVRVGGVTTTTTNSRSTEVILALDHVQSRGGSYLAQTTYNLHGRTYTSEDMAAAALRQALFREPAPDDVLSMTGGLGDPLARIPPGLGTETYRSVAALLITETLVETGRASRVDRVRISPSGPNGRHALVQWTQVASQGTAPGTQTVEGTIPP